MRNALLSLLVAILLPACTSAPPLAADPLPSWRDGLAHARILEFVEDVSDPSNLSFVPENQRIAVFDNDGTLWSEQPVYFQLLFAIDRVRQLAPEHPEWRGKQPFQAAIDGNLGELAAGGTEGVMELVMATHTGMTTADFRLVVEEWIEHARHPTLDRRYTELVFQPMLELLAYLREHGFQTWIVSGGGVEFMRVWAEQVYGIPPEQTIGSRVALRFEMRDGQPVLLREPKLAFLDDQDGKPIAIENVIGRRPILAFGNSDGDLQMLQWTMAGNGPHFAGLVHHTDADREFAYDRKSKIGKLDKALDEANAKGWLVVDMAKDWATVYTPAQPADR